MKHPFNEYLLLLAEFGVSGLLPVVLLGAGVVWRYKCHPGSREFMGLTVWVALSVLSLFSYPFKYPFSWLAAAMGGVLLFSSALGTRKRQFRPFSSVFIALFSVGLFLHVAKEGWYEYRWKRLVDKSMLGKTREVIPEYGEIAPHLQRNGYFLYNYAAELNYLGCFDESVEVPEMCATRLNDYDVQRL